MAASFTRSYVDGLFSVAGSAEAVEALLPSLEAFGAALGASEELRKVLVNPGLDRAKRRALFDAVARRAGVTGLAERLLSVVNKNRGIGALPAVLAAIRERLDEERRIVEARVTSARPVAPSVTDTVRRLVEARTKKTARVIARVDPSLLGGFVVIVGSTRIDASLSRRLEKARAALHSLPPT